MPDIHLAYIQANLAWEDKASNLERFGLLLQQVQPGTDLILMPETFTTAFPVDPKRFAETEDGPTMTWLRRQAQAKNAVICTTFPIEPRLDAPRRQLRTVFQTPHLHHGWRGQAGGTR